ncbi:MAG: hypothetical protein M1818_004508 [Claussenomyces sp. TS43310]|nr:MAG: hypothetical protein M1818_004508 [Claussenomyces sp. TS43310]
MLWSALCYLTLSFLFWSQAVCAEGVGLVGLGNEIFTPTCCYACLSSLWPLELSCSQSNLTKTFAPSTPQCHASNEAYLTSLAYCVRQKCTAEKVPKALFETCWAGVAGDGLDVGDLYSHLPEKAPTKQLGLGATDLSQTSLIDDAFTIMVASAASFCILLGLRQLKQSLVPNVPMLPRSLDTFIAKYLLVPALIGKRNIQALPFNIGHVPQRSLSILIAAYVALNVVFCALSYPLASESTWYLTSSNQLVGYIANRLGYLSIANIALTIIFSTHNTLLLYVTGCARTDSLTFHRWTGRIATVEGVVHGAMYLFKTDAYGANFFTRAAGIHYLAANEIYWTFGVITMATLILVVVFSILPIRKHWYEAFLILHIALAVMALVALWYHLTFRFKSIYGYQIWLYVAFAAWGLDRVYRVIKICVLNWRSLIGRTPTAKVELLPGGEFFKITVWPSKFWKVNAGQFCYLYFPSLSSPFKSHPFTIASWSTGIADLLSTDDHLSSKISSLRLSDTGLHVVPFRSTYPGPVPLSGPATAASPESLEKSNSHLWTVPYACTSAGPGPIIGPGIMTSLDKELYTVPYAFASDGPVPLFGPGSATSPTISSLDRQSTINFTVDKHQDKPSISFLIRPSAGLTKSLHTRLNGSIYSPISLPVLIEGPYGGISPAAASADTIICFARGIGITSILSYLGAYLRSYSNLPYGKPVGESVSRRGMHAQRFVIYWSVYEASLVDAVRRQLPPLDLLWERNVDLTILCAQNGDHRLDVGATVRGELEGTQRCGQGCRTTMLVCGPGDFADDVRAHQPSTTRVRRVSSSSTEIPTTGHRTVLDPEVGAFLKANPALHLGGTGDFHAERSHHTQVFGFHALPTSQQASIHSVEHTAIQGPHGTIPIRIFHPKSGLQAAHDNRAAALIYFHGGSYTVGTIDDFENGLRILAEAAGLQVYAVEYRLAPEWRFPVQLDEYEAVVEWLQGDCGRKRWVGPGLVLGGGDSAGGNMTAAVCIRLRAQRCRKDESERSGIAVSRGEAAFRYASSY